MGIQNENGLIHCPHTIVFSSFLILNNHLGSRIIFPDGKGQIVWQNRMHGQVRTYVEQCILCTLIEYI